MARSSSVSESLTADFPSLYRQADRSLYEAKRRGRDCVVASGQRPDDDLAVGLVA